MSTPVTPPGSVRGSPHARGPDGVDRRRFILGAGAVAGLIASGVVPSLSGGAASAAGVEAGASRFVPLPVQYRLSDMRLGPNGQYPYTVVSSVGPGHHIKVQVTGRGGVPASATAAVLSVTVVNRSGFNFVTVYPSGVTMPNVSNVNTSESGQVVANMATVRLGGDGCVDVQTHDDCEVIIDVAGYFDPVTEPVAAGRLVTLDQPERVLDSRLTGTRPSSSRRQAVDLARWVPVDAVAAVVNLTIDGTTEGGFATCFPLGESTVPNASNLNFDGADQTRAVGVVARIGTDGARRGFQVAIGPTNSGAAGNLIVDLVGYYTGEAAAVSADGLFVPVDPVRITDTRLPSPARMWHDWMIEASVPGRAATAASAVALNATAVDSVGWGYLSVLPARSYRWSSARPGDRPNVSSVNFDRANQTVANQVLCRVTEGHGVSVYSFTGSHVLLDLAGFYTGTPRQPAVAAPSNPNPQSVAPEWTLRIPRLGVESRVLEGDSVEITDAGHSWHWSGTGDMGMSANVALFAHRTSAGAPYRNIHLLQPGDAIEIVTDDNRRFEYEMVNRLLTTDDRDEILAASRSLSTPSIALIACTRRNFLPTSLDYRIVVNARLVRTSEF